MMRRTFSVIIPTRNRPAQLKYCLESMASLSDVKGGFEVIVVDDAGTVALDDICAQFADRLTLLLIRQDAGGPGAARNQGASTARGEYLVFTADDCRANPDWLVRLQEQFSRHPDSLLGGTVRNGLSQEILASANQLIIDYLILAFGGSHGDPRFFTPNNMAVPAEIFHKVGGFDASMGATGEDREFCFRWHSRGFSLVTANDAIVQHFHSQSFMGYFRQHMRYGRGSLRFHRRVLARGDEAEPRFKILPESNNFYWKLLTFPGTRYHFPKSILLSVTLGFAQLAIGLGFITELLSSSRNARNPNLLP
jgi:glycosyltransferase involved in cell wall biosynthesis